MQRLLAGLLAPAGEGQRVQQEEPQIGGLGRLVAQAAEDADRDVAVVGLAQNGVGDRARNAVLGVLDPPQEVFLERRIEQAEATLGAHHLADVELRGVLADALRRHDRAQLLPPLERRHGADVALDHALVPREFLV